MTDELSSLSLFITALEVLSILSLNVLSLTGNTLVCIAVFKNVRLRSTTNLYIVTLALSDLLSAIFGETYTRVRRFEEFFPQGRNTVGLQ